MPDPVPEKVQANVERLRCGEKLPPVTVCFDGSDYWLRDGFHRVEAARQVGLGNIEAEIIPGTLDEMEQEWKKMLREALKRLAREAEAEQFRAERRSSVSGASEQEGHNER